LTSTQLLFSFYLSDFASSIVHFQNASQQIYFCITPNLSILNSVKNRILNELNNSETVLTLHLPKLMIFLKNNNKIYCRQ